MRGRLADVGEIRQQRAPARQCPRALFHERSGSGRLDPIARALGARGHAGASRADQPPQSHAQCDRCQTARRSMSGPGRRRRSARGAAAALAAGLVPLADGSDLGGSLRNPANFNNVVALRPTVGLVPTAPTALPLLGFLAKGPMARTVRDAAFLLSVMAGADPRDPGCYPSDPSVFAAPLDRTFRGVRVAWCPDLGGLPLDRRVRAVLENQRAIFEDLGCEVDEACPDLSGADEVFLTVRAWRTASLHGPLLETHRDHLKPEAIAEIEAGLAVTGSRLARAMVMHGELMERMRRFEERYEFLLCAVNQLPPFDA